MAEQQSCNLDYTLLEAKTVALKDLWKWHMVRIINSVNRKISFKQKFKDPWQVTVQEFVYADCFIQWFRIIRDYKTARS